MCVKVYTDFFDFSWPWLESFSFLIRFYPKIHIVLSTCESIRRFDVNFLEMAEMSNTITARSHVNNINLNRPISISDAGPVKASSHLLGRERESEISSSSNIIMQRERRWKTQVSPGENNNILHSTNKTNPYEYFMLFRPLTSACAGGSPSAAVVQTLIELSSGLTLLLLLLVCVPSHSRQRALSSTREKRCGSEWNSLWL